MKRKRTKILTATLALLVGMLCVLGAGCGDEDLTFEDGEYTAVLVAQPRMLSSYETGFKVFIKNQELAVYEEKYYGILTKSKIDKRNWDSGSFDIYDDFDIEKIKNIGVCMKTNKILMGDYYHQHALMKIDKKIYLLDVADKEDNNMLAVVKVWELQPIS